MTPTKEIKCPHCGGKSEYSPANPFRPFCSARCQLIDLGEWASEKYSVPVEDAPHANADLKNKSQPSASGEDDGDI